MIENYVTTSQEGWKTACFKSMGGPAFSKSSQKLLFRKVVFRFTQQVFTCFSEKKNCCCCMQWQYQTGLYSVAGNKRRNWEKYIIERLPHTPFCMFFQLSCLFCCVVDFPWTSFPEVFIVLALSHILPIQN